MNQIVLSSSTSFLKIGISPKIWQQMKNYKTENSNEIFGHNTLAPSCHINNALEKKLIRELQEEIKYRSLA